MLRTNFILAVAAGLALAGCGRSEYRTYEGQKCSASQSEDPFYKCSPAEDLVCISTYSQGLDIATSRPVYLCRNFCTRDGRCGTGNVCCEGAIYGNTFDQTRACVPAEKCTTNPRMDAGTKSDARDSAAAGDGAIDTAATDTAIGGG